MSDELFEMNQGAKKNFIMKCTGGLLKDQCEPVTGDAWDEEEGNQLIADLIEPEIQEASDDSSVELVFQSPGKTDISTLKKCSKFSKYRDEELNLILRVDRLLKKMGRSAALSLDVEVKSIRSSKHVQLKQGKIVGNGFGDTRLEAFRGATEIFEMEFLKKFFPEEPVHDPKLKDKVETLKLFCRIKGLDQPVHKNTEVGGKYTSCVRVGDLEITVSGHRSLVGAEGAASKGWLDMHGDNWSKVVQSETKTSSSVFSDEEITEAEREEEISVVAPSTVADREVKIVAVKNSPLKTKRTYVSQFDTAIAEQMNSPQFSKNLRRSPRKQIAAAIFDSSCSSDIDPTPQKPSKTKKIQEYGNPKKRTRVDTSLDIDELLDPSRCRIIQSESKNPIPVKSKKSDLFSNDSDSESSDETPKFVFFNDVKPSSNPSPKMNIKINKVSTKKSSKTSKKETKTNLQLSPISNPDTETKSSSGFSFSNTDKEQFVGERRKKNTKKTLKSQDSNPKSILPEITGSSVFEYVEDAETAKIRKKLEKRELNKKKRAQRSRKSRESLSIAKFNRYSQIIDDPHESKAGNKKTKTPSKKGKKSKIKSPDKTPPNQKKITGFFKLSDDINELLKTPPEIEGYEDIENEFDPHLDEHIRKIDEYLEEERLEEIRYQEFLQENLKYRDRLEKELTEPVLKNMFQKNLKYLKKIWSGEECSDRYDMYKLGGGNRQQLMHSMITDPFTDEQLDWTLAEISKVWMRNHEERRENNDFIWKVLLPECFIKLYMDYFSFEKKEAEKRIRNTPLHEEDDIP